MSLENDRPESFLGLMMALEGVSDGYSIVHGPTGCKYYPASAAENGYPVRDGTAETRNVFRFANRYFFSQPRLPCTYLDMGKFVTGGKERLVDLYREVEKMHPSLISIVNSPGASLIGEHLESASGNIPTVYVDHAEYSGTCAEGFQEGILEILKVVKPKLTKERKGVNLLGIGIHHLNWEDTVKELSELLDLCGIEINTVVGAGWSFEDIENSASAELNVLVYPEYGDRIAKKYLNEYGIPFVGCGVPIGFDNLEKWILQICEKLGKNPSEALKQVKTGRKNAVKAIRIVESYHLLPKGHTFSLYCDGSLAYAVTEFLYGYLGMIPAAITCPNGKEWFEKTRKFIEERNIPCSDDALQTEADIMITSGTLGNACVSRGLVRDYAEVETPGTKYVGVRPESPIGLTGTQMLLDKVLNSVAALQRFL